MKTSRSVPMLNISQVERDTGLSKDSLRIWERRYGFPKPARDSHGERHYDNAQVQKLRVIKRLLDGGSRPRNLVGKSLAELTKLAAESAPESTPESAREAHGEIIEALLARQNAVLQQRLSQLLMRKGIQQFVLTTLAPLNVSIGEAWARGEIATHDEHLYTEHVQSLLRTAVQAMPRRAPSPRVLLTTLPQEQHGLGLLMVETLLASEGVPCIALGTQTPIRDIVAAASAYRADIVALSFSASFPTRAGATSLAEIRKEIEPRMTLWAGGRLMVRLKKLPSGIVPFVSLDAVLPALGAWQAQAAASSGQ